MIIIRDFSLETTQREIERERVGVGDWMFFYLERNLQAPGLSLSYGVFVLERYKYSKEYL